MERALTLASRPFILFLTRWGWSSPSSAQWADDSCSTCLGVCLKGAIHVWSESRNFWADVSRPAAKVSCGVSRRTHQPTAIGLPPDPPWTAGMGKIDPACLHAGLLPFALHPLCHRATDFGAAGRC